MTRSARSGRRPAVPRDPYGLVPTGSALAPILALAGLLVAALLTVSLLNGQLPFVTSSGGGGGGGAAGPGATPAPSNVVVVPKDPRADVPGSIVYAKQGSLWIQSGTEVRQLTTSGPDSSDATPAWTADGSWIYFIRTTSARALALNENGRQVWYTLTYPTLMRVDPAGGKPEPIVSGKYGKSGRNWFYWLRQPTPNPKDPEQLAVLSDQPDPSKSDVVLQLFDVGTKKYTRAAGAKEVAPLGHQDPAWHPRGTVLLYVKNDRDGRRGAPSIWRYDPAKDRSAQLTGPGYLAPSYSPDGKYVAATKTSPFGTDIVILDAATGGEILRVTEDGTSWSPAWSPRGDAIAFLHLSGQIVDLRMATLDGTGANVAVKEAIDLTEVSGLDGTSRPSWYIPADQLPPPSEAPSPSAASPSPSP
jgi:Tol biopolymer transport system component